MMQLKFLKFNKHNRSYDLFCNTFKRFYITKNRQAIVFLDTFLAPLSLNNVTNDSLNLYVSYTDFAKKQLDSDSR